MAKLTWLGMKDDEGGDTPPDVLSWNGIEFAKGKAVEVSDETMVRKAKGNRFFKVEDDGGDTALYPHPPAPTDTQPPYPPFEEEPKQVPRRSGGARPPRVRENDNGD